jgi:flagellar protein FliO/FliZ
MESLDLARYFIAVIFVLLLVGVAFLIKRYAANPGTFRIGLKTRLGKWEFTAPARRLSVSESLMLAPRQRLFLIRRDNVEHLVLSGPDGSTVLESGIPAPAKTEVLPS